MPVSGIRALIDSLNVPVSGIRALKNRSDYDAKKVLGEVYVKGLWERIQV